MEFIPKWTILWLSFGVKFLFMFLFLSSEIELKGQGKSVEWISGKLFMEYELISKTFIAHSSLMIQWAVRHASIYWKALGSYHMHNQRSFACDVMEESDRINKYKHGSVKLF